MPGESTDPVSVGDAAALIGKELGLASPLVLTRLVDAWSEMVGDVLAGHSRVRSIRNDVLEIAVDKPAWATEIRYLEEDLLHRAAQRVGPGVVTSIRVYVEPV
jgi:predicted nucleic acid-binding Zn ribbon protein